MYQHVQVVGHDAMADDAGAFAGEVVNPFVARIKRIRLLEQRLSTVAGKGGEKDATTVARLGEPYRHVSKIQIPGVSPQGGLRRPLADETNYAAVTA